MLRPIDSMHSVRLRNRWLKLHECNRDQQVFRSAIMCRLHNTKFTGETSLAQGRPSSNDRTCLDLWHLWARVCVSKIGFYSHRRTHRWTSVQKIQGSCRRLSPTMRRVYASVTIDRLIDVLWYCNCTKAYSHVLVIVITLD